VRRAKSAGKLGPVALGPAVTRLPSFGIFFFFFGFEGKTFPEKYSAPPSVREMCDWENLCGPVRGGEFNSRRECIVT
jgi:hypothetical protein